MPDLLDTAHEWLEAQRRAHLTKTVTYSRGADSVDLPVTIGRTVWEQVSGEATVARIESRDFLLTAADLILASVLTVPQVGDRIVEAAGNGTRTYEVVAPGAEQPWRYSDFGRRTIRVHTKLIDRST